MSRVALNITIVYCIQEAWLAVEGFISKVEVLSDTLEKNKEIRRWALNRVHNSRRPLDRLQYIFALWPNINL